MRKAGFLRAPPPRSVFGVPLPRRLVRLALALIALPLAALAVDEAPAAANALPRWREQFPALTELLGHLDLPLFELEAPDLPPPVLSPETTARLAALSERFLLAPDETLVFDPIQGPETPFPDHQPLRLLAALRTVLARRALADGDTAAALALVERNLAQARLSLRAQEGLIPLIHATGVWQSALDGVHALVLSPALPAPEARRLLAELQADAGLAQAAAARALRGEYTHVYKVIVERMPRTDDPELFLSSVASLGMAPPEPPEPGEIGLGLTDHVILDVPATLAAYEADLAPYLEHLARSPRLPRGLQAETTARTLAAYRTELGAFLAYASGELPPTLADTTLARAALEAATNPGGKLLAVFLTPPWEMMIGSALRRETQRAALCGLLAWRIQGGPTPWEVLVARGLLPAPPADPYSDGALCYELAPQPRVWSVFLDGRDNGGARVDSNSGQPLDLVWPALAPWTQTEP